MGRAHQLLVCLMTHRQATTRVLVVDDNEDAADVLSVLLDCEGINTAVAHSGEEAVALAKTFLPTVVLLDLNMPSMDGFETAVALHKEHPARLVAYSADNTRATVEKVAKSVFDGRLTKPAGLDELLDAIWPEGRF